MTKVEQPAKEEPQKERITSLERHFKRRIAKLEERIAKETDPVKLERFQRHLEHFRQRTEILQMRRTNNDVV